MWFVYTDQYFITSQKLIKTTFYAVELKLLWYADKFVRIHSQKKRNSGDLLWNLYLYKILNFTYLIIKFDLGTTKLIETYEREPNAIDRLKTNYYK